MTKYAIFVTEKDDEFWSASSVNFYIAVKIAQRKHYSIFFRVLT